MPKSKSKTKHIAAEAPAAEAPTKVNKRKKSKKGTKEKKKARNVTFPLIESSDEEVVIFDDGDKDDRLPDISEPDRLAFLTYFASEYPSIFVKIFGHANRVERHMNKALIEAKRLGIQMSYRQLKNFLKKHEDPDKQKNKESQSNRGWR